MTFLASKICENFIYREIFKLDSIVEGKQDIQPNYFNLTECVLLSWIWMNSLMWWTIYPGDGNVNVCHWQQTLWFRVTDRLKQWRMTWHMHPWPRAPGDGHQWSPASSVSRGVSGRWLSLSAATLRQCRHSPLTLQRSVLVGLCYPSDRCQWSNQCFVTPHNNKSIHLLMCCFVFCVTHWWLCYSNLCRKK